VRILEGYFAESNTEPNNVVILINVKVDDIISEVSSWSLRLTREAIVWRRPSWQPLTDVNEINIVNLERAFNVGPPIPKHIPDKGWLAFQTHKEPEILDHIFGATFVLTAHTLDGRLPEGTRTPGDWLHRATGINFC
jgi:hypothetical protein